jgi:hypothetical protein
VYVNPHTNRVESVSYPAGKGTFKQLESKYGPLDEVWFEWDRCDGRGQKLTRSCGLALFESKAGNVLFYMARSKGVYMYLAYSRSCSRGVCMDSGPVRFITFSISAPGPKVSTCTENPSLNAHIPSTRFYRLPRILDGLVILDCEGTLARTPVEKPRIVK